MDPEFLFQLGDPPTETLFPPDVQIEPPRQLWATQKALLKLGLTRYIAQGSGFFGPSTRDRDPATGKTRRYQCYYESLSWVQFWKLRLRMIPALWRLVENPLKDHIVIHGRILRGVWKCPRCFPLRNSVGKFLRWKVAVCHFFWGRPVDFLMRPLEAYEYLPGGLFAYRHVQGVINGICVNHGVTVEIPADAVHVPLFMDTTIPAPRPIAEPRRPSASVYFIKRDTFAELLSIGTASKN